VRYSIKDAKQMSYPYDDVVIKIYVLDDGKRERMKAVAAEEEVFYLTRANNTGYKAGNLKNALERTDGDLFVILDADTRPFKKLLENTTGYFRNHKMAWVQTPQWFYDLTEPVRVTTFVRWMLNINEPEKPNLIDKTIGSIRLGKDVFGNDPQIFYDVIQRRRNNYNAAFCCGAGSIHRRKAILGKALDNYVEEVKMHFSEYLKKQKERGASAGGKLERLMKIRKETEVRTFVYHASEDIYTSLFIHADRYGWKSYQHPDVECKMLSPQDLDGWVKQRTRYASGSLDIALRNNPLFMKGLSLGQRLCYFQTVYSYFAPFWLLVFLLSPAIFFFTLTPPLSTFNFDFFKIFIPFQILNVVTMTLGTWGIPTNRADQYYVSSFWLMLKSFIAILKGEKVQFHVTRKTGRVAKSLQYVIPHLMIIAITLAGMAYNGWLIWKGTHPSYSGFAANALWALFNFYNMGIIVVAAFWKGGDEQ
jgi:cellulose synthase (UDP-forming)